MPSGDALHAGRLVATMDPPEPLERQELREPNDASDELDIAEQGRVPRTGDSASEGQALRKRNVEEEQGSTKQRQEEQQWKERVDRKRAAEQRVFNDVQARLFVYDERESLLAKKYRDVEKERKGREEREWQKRREGQKHREDKAPAKQQPQPAAAAQRPHPEDRLFKEVKNLVFIDRSPVLKKALEDWARKETLLTSRVERKSLRVEGLKNEVYQLIGFFSVFQGVVLTAVSQANLLHCNNKWSPILLSLLASVVTIAAIAQKLFQISALQETIHTEKQALQDVVKRGRELRREGPNFVFAKFSEHKAKEPKDYSFWLYSSIVLGFLVLFTVVFPVSYWRILCHPDPCST